MRVRFFNTYEPVTTFYRDLLPYLAERGIASEVLISSSEYRQGGRGNLSEAFSSPEIRVKFISTHGIEPTRQVQKAVIMLSYVFGSMGKSLFGVAADINFFLTQPPLFNLWGWMLKKLRRQSYICVVMDIYPNVAVMDGMLPAQGLVTRLLTNLNRFALRRADAVIVIGRCMAERVEAMGVRIQKIHLIPNWANPEIVYPIVPEKNKLRRELGLDGKFVVLYSGNMGISHDFNDLLDVIRRCREEAVLHFVFIGGGMRRKEIEKVVAAYHLKNVNMLPFQPMERLAESLSLGDVHFISLREGFEGSVVPSKVYGAMAAGRAVIYQGDTNGEVARMIQEEGIGALVPPSTPGQLEQVIRNYMQCPDRVEQQGLAARRLTEGKYAASTIMESYYQVISKITDT